jgi:hypothetical protein
MECTIHGPSTATVKLLNYILPFVVAMDNSHERWIAPAHVNFTACSPPKRQYSVYADSSAAGVAKPPGGKGPRIDLGHGKLAYIKQPEIRRTLF